MVARNALKRGTAALMLAVFTTACIDSNAILGPQTTDVVPASVAALLQQHPGAVCKPMGENRITGIWECQWTENASNSTMSPAINAAADQSETGEPVTVVKLASWWESA